MYFPLAKCRRFKEDLKEGTAPFKKQEREQYPFYGASMGLKQVGKAHTTLESGCRLDGDEQQSARFIGETHDVRRFPTD
jgi:hypothetical protein